MLLQRDFDSIRSVRFAYPISAAGLPLGHRSPLSRSNTFPRSERLFLDP